MKKKGIAVFLVLALFSGLLTGCAIPDQKYQPGAQRGNYKWVCDEIDMWFVDKSYYPCGELTLNEETKDINVFFCLGRPVWVEEYLGVDDQNLPICEDLFREYGYFHKKWFSLKVREDYIDYVGFEKLKFRRVELDEEDLAWLEAEHPESLPDEDELGPDQTASP